MINLDHRGGGGGGGVGRGRPPPPPPPPKIERPWEEIFYEDLKLPILKKTPKGQPSTNEDVMQELSLTHELTKLILQYRNLMKLKNTYTDRLGKQINESTNRLHTSYNQTVTITG